MELHKLEIVRLMTAQQFNQYQYENGDIGHSEFNRSRREILAEIKELNNKKTGGFAMREAHEKGMVR